MKATKVNAGLAESNGRLLLPGLWRDSLHVTCGLTACTPGSAPGPRLGNEYGKTLPFTYWGSSRLKHGLCSSLYTDEKGKGSPYSTTERRVPELIPVLGSQPGGRLPLLSARPAVTPATLKRAATNFAA